MTNDADPSDEWWSFAPKKLGWGDWHDPAEAEPIPVRYGRQIFWDCLWGIAPEVFHSLRKNVLPAYRERPTNREAYGAALSAWSTRWNLVDDWIKRKALLTLDLWRLKLILEPSLTVEEFDPVEEYRTKDREEAWKLESPDDAHSSIWSGPTFVTLRIPTWFPDAKPWEDFRTEVLEAVEWWLQQQRAVAEEVFQELDLAEVPTKRQRGGLPRDAHFRWLVRFQVLEHTEKEIAASPLLREDRTSLSLRSVQDAIRETADFIGLSRRSL